VDLAGRGPAVTASVCWQAFCIAGDCDGVHHVDATGYGWAQQRGETYCVQHDAYDRCGHNGPVFTDYERHERDV
jgi:hypothetical protein